MAAPVVALLLSPDPPFLSCPHSPKKEEILLKSPFPFPPSCFLQGAEKNPPGEDKQSEGNRKRGLHNARPGRKVLRGERGRPVLMRASQPEMRMRMAARG